MCVCVCVKINDAKSFKVFKICCGTVENEIHSTCYLEDVSGLVWLFIYVEEWKKILGKQGWTLLTIK